MWTISCLLSRCLLNVSWVLQAKLQKEMALAFTELQRQVALIQQQSAAERKAELKELQQQFLEVIKVDMRREMTASFLEAVGEPCRELQSFAEQLPGINQKLDQLDGAYISLYGVDGRHAGNTWGLHTNIYIATYVPRGVVPCGHKLIVCPPCSKIMIAYPSPSRQGPKHGLAMSLTWHEYTRLSLWAHT
jgi:hypothetical protein